MNMKENETNSFGERTPQTRDVHLPPDSASPSSPWGAWNLLHHIFSFFLLGSGPEGDEVL